MTVPNIDILIHPVTVCSFCRSASEVTPACDPRLRPFSYYVLGSWYYYFVCRLDIDYLLFIILTLVHSLMFELSVQPKVSQICSLSS
jgi:hypothetical protein